MPPVSFRAPLRRPANNPSQSEPWWFVVLPTESSASLPRRGRTTVTGTINGRAPFQATLEPDGQLSHWLKLNDELRRAAGAEEGDTVAVELRPVETEPEPQIPDDLAAALAAAPQAARDAWNQTTTIARVDWIHWMTSAKQPRTRTKRVADACDKLASGKKRVCCFDPSGHYSKAFCAPEAADE
ncbi:hypothetical protein CAOG_04103 [Capsaspora owczarzaki ATCC 30864]|uniref:DUF1905 domain-containing protein n=1 Tax=Capsaspora owczarzaki (strain ATCC 30864) TaxID=595528 RepID=A0A0D2VR31_CAPO3|nr:hypothetical protein CAOG_04103 [Capsaspora owczarzaki ATCC 30864]KJE93297.1 hypothetical protein CAOG_004103 [Capsaspora owczarzaki ATCC 30864]|eukprot:XP_004347928.1 hypothetical protein CAOG_04103 [Capsaspora owczarzaki ATCC 30864]